MRDRRLLLLHSPGRELSDVSSRQEVHHRCITLFHGKQFRELHVSESARFPSCCIPHRFPEHFLLVFPSAAAAAEPFPCLCRSAFSGVLPAFVVISVPEPFQIHTYWWVPGLQSVEPGCQWLHTIHWDESLTSRLALQSVAVVLATLVGIPLSLRHQPRFRDLFSPSCRHSVHSFWYGAWSADFSGLVWFAICFLIPGNASVSEKPVDPCFTTDFAKGPRVAVN